MLCEAAVKTSVRVATFNVNSISRRAEQVCAFLQEGSVDVLLLQELKCREAQFPFNLFANAGWRAAVVGEKGYNGVAVLSRMLDLEVRLNRLPFDDEDRQARYLEVDLGWAIVASLYAPNGNPIGGDKFPYKLAWLDRLSRHVEETLLYEGRPFLLGGDFNICPESNDVFDETIMEGDALVHRESRRRYRRLINSGLLDAFRAEAPLTKGYSYWDYRQGRFARDEGLRIDMILLSPGLSEGLEGCFVARDLRAQPNPSDHTPVYVDLKVAGTLRRATSRAISTSFSATGSLGL